MTRDELQRLLDDLGKVRVAVFGDFCLDMYWAVDPSSSEPSQETGKPTHPVREQRYSLGGAGNVASNLTALGCAAVSAFGVVGSDPWGREMRHLLREIGVDTTGLLLQEENWATLAYNKPFLGDDEQNRFDFGRFNRLNLDTAEALTTTLAARLAQMDVIIIYEQVRGGIHGTELHGLLNELMAAHPHSRFVVSTRHLVDAYPGAIRCLNDRRAAATVGVSRPPGALILRSEAAAAAEALFAQTRRAVVISRGARGVLVRDDQGLHEIPGVQVLDRVDPLGAGDSLLAGLAAALGTGRPPLAAACLGNFVAAVTVRKLRQTGTASPAEVMAVGGDPDYVYRPELAEDPRQARLLPGTEFEVVTAVPEKFHARHVIFDCDGTISTLRQGWEAIMEPMMVKAILGPCFASADESVYHQVVARVRHFIEQTTGIQTLYQMQGLVRLVREFGLVPAADVLDEHGYKEIYNEALLDLVNQRLDKLRRGELEPSDYTVKNAVRLLERLQASGARLYLASGTDEADVAREAALIGFSPLFTGGIFGASRDATHDAKRMVLDRILREIGAQAGEGLVTFGDGPVEMRETHKRGGLAIGVASDEVRRFGLNPTKRARLIRGGADLIIPDFSQLGQLLKILGIHD